MALPEGKIFQMINFWGSVNATTRGKLISLQLGFKKVLTFRIKHKNLCCTWNKNQ